MVGVTAWTVEDARSLILEATRFDQLPTVTRLLENIDVSTLDQEHVVQNMTLRIRGAFGIRWDSVTASSRRYWVSLILR